MTSQRHPVVVTVVLVLVSTVAGVALGAGAPAGDVAGVSPPDVAADGGGVGVGTLTDPASDGAPGGRTDGPRVGAQSTWRSVHVDPDEPQFNLDVETVSVREDADTFLVRVEYNGDFRTYSQVDLTVYIDADQDRSTGFDLGHQNAIGADYLLYIWGDPDSLGGSAYLMEWDWIRDQFQPAGPLAHADVNLGTDTYEVGVFRTTIGSPAAVDFSVQTLDFTTQGGGWDYAPDQTAVQPYITHVFDAGGTPTPTPEPPVVGTPPGGTYRTLATDGDEAALPVDLAGVAAQHDAETLYVRFDYHGDYAPDTPVRSYVYVDSDRNPNTGSYVASMDLGVDYVLGVEPEGFLAFEWSPVAREFQAAPIDPRYVGPDFAGDAHAFGVSRASIGDPAAVEMAAVLFDSTDPENVRSEVVPASGAVTYRFGSTTTTPTPTPTPTPEPPGPGEWELLWTDRNELFVPVNVGTVSARHDAGTLYFRYTYWGFFNEESPIQTRTYLDVDRSFATGAPVGSIGADYVVLHDATEYTLLRWNDGTGRFEATGATSPHFVWDRPERTMEVGTRLSALPDRGETVGVVVKQVYGFDTDDPVDSDDPTDTVPDSGSLSYRVGAAVPGGSPFDGPIPGTSLGLPPSDLDGDGLYEDVDGDGDADFADAVDLAFVDATALTAAQISALDFDGDGDLDFADAVDLAFRV